MLADPSPIRFPRSRVAPLSLLVVVLCVLPLTAGCKTVKEAYADAILQGETITYRQYLSMDQNSDDPPSADAVIARLGKPAAVHDVNGRRRKIVYNAFSLADELKKAEFYFNDKEILVKKELW